MRRHLSILCFLFSLPLMAQNVTISGYVKDASTGETLIGANIYNALIPGQGTATNAYGFYSLTLPKGNYQLVFSYLGYQDHQADVALENDQTLNVQLSEGVSMEEVVVVAEQNDRNVTSTDMGKIDLPIENIKLLPAVFGEVDILKALQLLPGVMSSGEGSSGFYVRGGGADQNLILLDEAPVYNTGHLLGFFSVFNADAIKNTTLIKGDMPAQYGGRLSSVVDVQMKEGNNQSYSIDGGIGLIASRLTVQGPLLRDKSSFIISARRTYALDLAQPLIRKSNFAGTNYYFYDLNTKLNYQFSQKDRIYLSGYFGRDVFAFNSNQTDFNIRMPYGNATATLRWNHLFNDKLFMNTSLIYNDYDFSFSGGQDLFKFKLFSGVRDWNTKVDFDYYPNYHHSIRFGVNAIHHRFVPNVVQGSSGDVEFGSDFTDKYGLESAAYVQDDIKLSASLNMQIGLRYSRFTQIGPYTSKQTDTKYGSWDPVIHYDGWEPRVALRWQMAGNTSLKAAVTFTNQYIHLVSNSASTLPTDVWVPSTEVVKPQQGIQYALGLFKNWYNDNLETSFEVYYRDLKNQIDYRDSYVNNLSNEVEDEFVFGIGRAYGAELFVRKSKGNLNGWIGYTYSRSERSFPDIEEGRWYPTTFDRTNDASLVVNYQLSDRWSFGGVVVYGTGRAYTPIQSVYLIGQDLVTQYGPRNSSRLEPYHRLDLSATLKPNPDSKKRFQGSWTFSIYNTYNRRNTYFTYTDVDTDLETGQAEAKAYKVSIFPIIPSVTWNFKWK
ncbi:MAG: TonB-dependent receptor [Saprospiraceae bacterium]